MRGGDAQAATRRSPRTILDSRPPSLWALTSGETAGCGGPGPRVAGVAGLARVEDSPTVGSEWVHVSGAGFGVSVSKHSPECDVGVDTLSLRSGCVPRVLCHHKEPPPGPSRAPDCSGPWVGMAVRVTRPCGRSGGGDMQAGGSGISLGTAVSRSSIHRHPAATALHLAGKCQHRPRRGGLLRRY